MKKRMRIMTSVISAMLIFAMLVTNASAAAFSLDFLRDSVTSFEGTYTLSAELKKPLLIFEDMPEIKQLENYGPDFAKIVESLLGSSAVVNIKSAMSPDYKKAEIYYDLSYNIPLELCEKLKITADVFMRYWVSYDFTDLENPQLKIIYDIPFAKKYVYFDYAHLAAQDESLGVAISKVFDRDFISRYTEKFAEIIENNASIEKKSTGVTIKFDDAGVKKLISEYYVTVTEMLSDMLGEEAAKPVLDDLKLPDEIMALENVQFFGEDGFTVDVVLDRLGSIKELNYVIDLDFNLVDVISAIDGSAVPAWMKRENADIAVALKFNGAYDKVNKNVTVAFPELTEENSFNPFEITEPTEGTENMPYIPDNDRFLYLYTEKFLVKNDTGELKIYYGFRDAIKGFGMDDSTITYDNGALTFENTDASIGVKNIAFSVGDTRLTVDGEEAVLEDVPINQGGTVYVTADFLVKAFMAKESEVSQGISIDGKETNAILTMYVQLNEDALPSEDLEVPIENGNETFISVASDAVEIKNGVFYIPIDAYLGAFSEEYDIDVYMSAVEYAKDSDKVKVNGSELTLNAPVIEIDGVLYGDASFAEAVFFAEMVYGDYSIADKTLYCDFVLTAKG